MAVLNEGVLVESQVPQHSQPAKVSRMSQDQRPCMAEHTDLAEVIVAISAHMREDYSVQLALVKNGEAAETVSLDPLATAALLEVLRVVSIGQGYAIESADYEMTSQQAANHLCCRHECFLQILDEGHVPFTQKGEQRLVQASDLFAYRRKEDAMREKALTELVHHDQEMDLL